MDALCCLQMCFCICTRLQHPFEYSSEYSKVFDPRKAKQYMKLLRLLTPQYKISTIRCKQRFHIQIDIIQHCTKFLIFPYQYNAIIYIYHQLCLYFSSNKDGKKFCHLRTGIRIFSIYFPSNIFIPFFNRINLLVQILLC